MIFVPTHSTKEVNAPASGFLADSGSTFPQTACFVTIATEKWRYPVVYAPDYVFGFEATGENFTTRGGIV